MVRSAYETLYKVLMNINEDGCLPCGMAPALMVIVVCVIPRHMHQFQTQQFNFSCMLHNTLGQCKFFSFFVQYFYYSKKNLIFVSFGVVGFTLLEYFLLNIYSLFNLLDSLNKWLTHLKTQNFVLSQEFFFQCTLEVK